MNLAGDTKSFNNLGRMEGLMGEIGTIVTEVAAEVERATHLWGPHNSAHEGFAVILEEMDELKVHVWTNQKKRDIVAMRKEAIQVAAMAVRFVLDVCNEERGRR